MIKKIECLKRFFEIAGQELELRAFLVGEKIAKESDFAELHRKQEVAEKYYLIMREAEKQEQIILLYYEWQLLAKESIKITISTERNHKELTHGY